MTAEVVQMNIRLNAQTKKRADQLIEQAGYTTTQFLRVLWDQLARPESDEDTVRRILTAAAPEEQDIVSPLPRSQTLIKVLPLFIPPTNSTFGTLSAGALS